MCYSAQMPQQRIVSLLPSATEILFALGLDAEIVGVSHECDFPPAARTKKVVIHSRISKDATPLEIDRQVREFSARGESIYSVDAEALRSLSPDLIITQDLCHVCAASPEDLAAILADFERKPEVLCLNPLELGDVWRDILWVGEETFRGHAAEKLIDTIGQKLGSIEEQIHGKNERPTVAFLEWLQPMNALVPSHAGPSRFRAAGNPDPRAVRLFRRASPRRVSLHGPSCRLAGYSRSPRRSGLFARRQQLFLASGPPPGHRPGNARQNLPSGN